MRPLRSLATLLVALAGCGSDGLKPGEQDCAQDGTCPGGFQCFPDWRCYPPGSTPACRPTCFGEESLCDPATLRCVACLADTDCLVGYVCGSPLRRCVPGCSAVKPGCSHAALSCDVDLGVCRGCLTDAECPDANNHRCDPESGRCVACLPDNDNCPIGSFCSGMAGNYACGPGCKSVADCGGADAGASAGACCDSRCVDTDRDSNNCGGCGIVCRGQKSCCGGACIEVTTDLDNCGACGNSCDVGNVRAPRCTAGKCSNGGCEDYFQNCDGNLANGCEVNLTADANNCYSCGHVCDPYPHMVPTCTVSGCSPGPCVAGWADCDRSAYNGCEYPTASFTTDKNNCGACGVVCSGNLSCVNGKCQ